MVVLSKIADILQTFFKEVRYGIESCLGGVHRRAAAGHADGELHR